MTDSGPPPPAGTPVASPRPFLVLVASHWVSLVGVGIALFGLLCWLLLLPLQVRGHAQNPYIGILAFVIVPLVFFLGLALVPIGVFLARRRIRNRFSTEVLDRSAAYRRLAIALGASTVLNVAVGTQLTYRAVEHMETVQFCGQSCHVMTPEFTGHQNAPHAQVTCVECHVAPGVGGWVQSKMAGTRQLVETIFDSHRRPIPSALETNRLVPARQTCELCHWRENQGSVRLRLMTRYAEDEANTESQTVLTMMVGGPTLGGIHGSHMAPGIGIRYATSDAKRQVIPWVEYRNAVKGESRTYLAKEAKASEVAGLPKFEMQCVDCHNRATHAFDTPEGAMDRALARGRLSTSLPYLKKKGVEVLKASYATGEEAARKIPAAIDDYYRQERPDVYRQRKADIESAGVTVAALYARNVFPELKVTWGTYPNNIGHTDFPGCFRCHDESHATAEGKTISQDCGVCHEAVAVEEASPEILKTLGLADRVAALKKP
jgi:nitrate/TMAO reductase-like tetraheme cytochrome c subunit